MEIKERKKEDLNIIIADGSESIQYVDYLGLYYNVNVLDPKNVKRTTDVDLVLFTGGADVDPAYYKEAVGKYTGVDKNRDAKEISIFEKFYSRPKLGICRGSQLLTVLSDGKLIQHVSGHTSEHMIEIAEWGEYLIPSTHHQMMFPYNLSKNVYQLKAWSSKFLSDTHLNGKNEEIELPSDFYEPEIVEYYKTKSLCIQGHPEFGNPQIKNVTLLLVDEFLNKFKVKKSNQYNEDFIEIDDNISLTKRGVKSWMDSIPTIKSSIGITSSLNTGSIKVSENNYDWKIMAADGTFRDNGRRPAQYVGGIDSISNEKIAEEQPYPYYNTFSEQDLKKALDGLKSPSISFKQAPIRPAYTLEDSKEQLK
jgi:GMP synthase-like glutamine amidotransferase